MASVSNPNQPCYIWQQPGWPAFTVDERLLAEALHQARLEQGRLLGQLEAIGLDHLMQINRELWVQDALATAAIEGDQLQAASVRSSVARRLGLSDVPSSDRTADGLVELMEDASRNHATPLTHDRLKRWQTALFSANTVHGFAGIRRIAVGRYRDHENAMQIVSGIQGREVVHFEAPASRYVPREMNAFLTWFNAPKLDAAPGQAGAAKMQPRMGGLVRAAIAHLWFESIHPFEDGNGRIGRAVADMALAQDVGSAARAFGLSTQILASRRAYYDALNAAQRDGLDVTPWVLWFVQTFTAACLRSQAVVRAALQKSAFWHRAAAHALNERQRKVLARLLEAGDGGFLGGMTADKYSKINAVSKPTATRDLTQLHAWGLLVVTGVGKATRYAVAVEGWGLNG